MRFSRIVVVFQSRRRKQSVFLAPLAHLTVLAKRIVPADPHHQHPAASDGEILALRRVFLDFSFGGYCSDCSSRVSGIHRYSSVKAARAIAARNKKAA